MSKNNFKNLKTRLNSKIIMKLKRRLKKKRINLINSYNKISNKNKIYKSNMKTK